MVHKSNLSQVVKCGSRRSFDCPSGADQFIMINVRCLESEKFKSGKSGNKLRLAIKMA
jgi:hypothetical protein